MMRKNSYDLRNLFYIRKLQNDGESLPLTPGSGLIWRGNVRFYWRKRGYTMEISQTIAHNSKMAMSGK